MGAMGRPLRSLAAVVAGLALLAMRPAPCPCPGDASAPARGHECCAPPTGVSASDHACCAGRTVEADVATPTPVAAPLPLLLGPVRPEPVACLEPGPRPYRVLAPSPPPSILRL
jgi:hypothetical protein